MTSREEILNRIAQGKPPSAPLPEGIYIPEEGYDVFDRFKTNVQAVGAEIIMVTDRNEIIPLMLKSFPHAKRIISDPLQCEDDPHLLEDVDIAIINADWGVAENGALWITDNSFKHCVLPFITQQLVLIIERENILANLQEAYQKIKSTEYHFGCFICGPSKTADIEQSLIIGAHGARSLTVAIISPESI